MKPTRRWRYLISFSGISLTIAFGSTVAFVLLADAVLSERLLNLNSCIMHGIRAQANPSLDSIALALTWIGSTMGITAISIPFAWFLIRRQAIADLVAFSTSVLGSVALTWMLKSIFQTVRPQLFAPLEFVTSPSFPSGHTLSSFCALGFIALWIVYQRPRSGWRWLVAALLLALASLIGASRVYIGVHWPTDVVGGVLLAIVWIAAALVGERRTRTVMMER